MVQMTRWCVPAVALACLSIAPAGCSEASKGPEATADAAVEGAAEAVAAEGKETASKAALEEAIRAHTEEALAVLKHSADFLAQQQSFILEARMGSEVLQVTGQKLEFGRTRKATVRRPDRLRVEVKERDGEERTLFFDGETIWVDMPSEKAYVSVRHPGTLDAALDYLVEDLGTPSPLEDFLSSNFYSEVEGKIESGFYVEDATIAGRLCEHLAFRSSEVDLQIWIESGDRPLPRRLVITYKRAKGSPQFWAQFSDWDLSPETPDSLFAFAPPEGAKQLDVWAAVQEITESVEGR